MGTGGAFLKGKAAGKEPDHSPPTSAEVRQTWVYTSTPPYAFMGIVLNYLNTGTNLPYLHVVGNLACKPSNFRKRVRKVINKEKLRGDHRSGVK
jgi:hypothetical protein